MQNEGNRPLASGDIVTDYCYEALNKKGTVVQDLNWIGTTWEVIGEEGGWPRLSCAATNGKGPFVTLNPADTHLILHVIDPGKEAA